MIVVYLPSYAFRGVSAPYLWIFYKLLTTYGEKLHFLIGDEYLRDVEEWRTDDRWELLEESQKRQGYRLPTSDELANVRRTPFCSDFLQRKLIEHDGNPEQSFYDYLTRIDVTLMDEFHSAFEKMGKVEAVLNWCNCPSLSEVGKKRSFSVINMELGPLRQPFYLPTGYLDFQGVNGNTEAAQRYFSVSKECNIDLSLTELREYFSSFIMPEFTHEYKLGVVLQVENDSNLIAFSNNFSNQSLLDYAMMVSGRSDFLVRSHPGSAFQVNGELYNVDTSKSSVDFIARCSELITINSSVGLEAILLGVPVAVKGQTSFSYILDTDDEKERINRLGFYLFSYLVPYPLNFDLYYILFRLNKPSENEIIKRHIQFYECMGDEK